MKSFSEDPNNFFNSNIETFDSFCKKYKKNNYISINDKKKLKSIGVDFEGLQNKVLDCINFFKKQDLDLLHDLLYYVIDDVDSVNKFGNIWFSIKYEVDYNIDDEIRVSKLDDELSIISSIGEHIYDKLNVKIDQLNYRKDKDFLDRYSLEKLKKTNINKIKLSPVINIDFYFKKNKDNKTNSLVNYLRDEIINRYFDQIKVEPNNIHIFDYPKYDYEYNVESTTIKIY